MEFRTLFNTSYSCVLCTLIYDQNISENFLIFFTVVLLKQFCLLDACSGGGWAAPFVFGPTSEANTAIFGFPGRRQYYSVQARGNLLPLLCCEGKGFRNGRQYWGVIGCRNDGRVSGSVEWGNNLSKPAVRCRGSPNGILYSFSC